MRIQSISQSYHVYECVGDPSQKRIDNAKARKAGVGRERRINSGTMADKRARLSELRKLIRSAE